MDPEVTEQILDELLPAFQSLETQSTAIMQFLKGKGIANDDQLAPYLEQAANASSVRWRAVRIRMARLLASLEKSSERTAKEPVTPTTEQTQKTAEKSEDKRLAAAESNAEKSTEPTSKDQQVSDKDKTAGKGNEQVAQERTTQDLDHEESHPIQPDRKPSERTKSAEKDAESENNRSASSEPERKGA